MKEDLINCDILNVFHTQEGATVLLDPGEGVLVPIQVSTEQGKAIQLGLYGEQFFRPMTHDLMTNFIRGQGIELDRVIIEGMMGSTILAELVLVKDDQEFSYDTRPSDGIALALRNDSDILIHRDLVDKIGVHIDYFESEAEVDLKKLNMKSIEIIESEDIIEIISELPDVEDKDDISIDVYPKSVKLQAITPKGELEKIIKLPANVQKEIQMFSFTNKILELKLRKVN